MDPLNRTEDPLEIFQMVLRSLESHREAKAEHDLLDGIGTRYSLSGNRVGWPNQLVAHGVEVDAFLKFVLELLSPFVEMFVDIYDFLHRYVSTTGGRTQHFAIDSEDLANPWSFDVSKLPKEVRWISAWMDRRIEEVAIDWHALADCLGNDNGIFYARVGDVRLIQTMIVDRRDGRLGAEMRRAGDRIYEGFRRAARAWYFSAARTAGRSKDLLLSAYVPGIRRDLGIDLAVVLGGASGSYRAEQAFRDLGSGTDIASVLRENEQNYAAQSVVFFCALWGLEEESFRRTAGMLRKHESSVTSLDDMRGPLLAESVIACIDNAIQPTGNITHERQKTKLKLEILLLPYWKDRWFLYEVWTLIRVLRIGDDLGARLHLNGVKRIAEPNVIGTSWHLPTQKAKSPVATLLGAERALLVWFQRETRRRDSRKNMEPDVRLTEDADPYADLAIVECKDRIKFAGAKADRIVDSYVTGSEAPLVWLVNYEEDAGAGARFGSRGAQAFGVAAGFRPDAIPSLFQESLESLMRGHLDLVRDPPPVKEIAHYLVIDTSGSMRGKTLAGASIVEEYLQTKPDHVKVWADDVSDFDASRVAGPRLEIRGSSAEDGAAFERFANTLPGDAKLTVITDDSGRADLLTSGVTRDGRSYSIAGRPLDIIVV